MGKQKDTFLVLDSRNTALGMGVLLSPPGDPVWQVEILDDDISRVMEHEAVQLIPVYDSGPPLMARILRCRNDCIVIEKLQTLDSDMRQNLRVPVHFKSFIYPLEGGWRGRREVESNDLSCGGIAFFTDHPLNPRERLELVIPVTEQPLILRCEILRQRPTDREGIVMYAAKFVNMCYDEEIMVRETVFTIQLTGRARR